VLGPGWAGHLLHEGDSVHGWRATSPDRQEDRAPVRGLARATCSAHPVSTVVDVLGGTINGRLVRSHHSTCGGTPDRAPLMFEEEFSKGPKAGSGQNRDGLWVWRRGTRLRARVPTACPVMARIGRILTAGRRHDPPEEILSTVDSAREFSNAIGGGRVDLPTGKGSSFPARGYYRTRQRSGRNDPGECDH